MMTVITHDDDDDDDNDSHKHKNQRVQCNMSFCITSAEINKLSLLKLVTKICIFKHRKTYIVHAG